MHKKINHLLLDSLISSDFLLLKKQSSTQHNLNLLDLIKLKKNLYINILHPLDLLKGLKQYIRLLLFLKKQKKFKLNFFVEDLHQKSIINNFFKYNNLNLNFAIFSKFIIAKSQKNSIQCIFFFKELITKSVNLINSFLIKKIYLVQEVNSNFGSNYLGTYKIFNTLSDYKKLIFLLIILSQVLKKR